MSLGKRKNEEGENKTQTTRKILFSRELRASTSNLKTTQHKETYCSKLHIRYWGIRWLVVGGKDIFTTTLPTMSVALKLAVAVTIGCSQREAYD